jgi:glycosyltransferase involved in cell wall biosynthesis
MQQRPQYLLQALAHAGHEVWFVDPRLSGPVEIDEYVHVVPSLQETPKSSVILYTHFAPNRTLIDRYQEPIVVYDLLDDLAIYDESEQGLSSEKRVRHHHLSLVREAGIVIVSNRKLMSRHRSEREDLMLVENGVDLGRFTPNGPVASSVPDGQIVGFHGAIAPWIDFDLVATVATLRPGLTFVLVGPVDPLVEHEAARLKELPNVTLLAAQPSSTIAAYVRTFNVGILPFVVNHMTRAVTPLKMYEYLACGIPVVATPLPACLDQSFVRTAAEPDEFVLAIDAALQDPSTRGNKLRQAAELASWDHRVRPLLSRLAELSVRSVP